MLIPAWLDAPGPAEAFKALQIGQYQDSGTVLSILAATAKAVNVSLRRRPHFA
jgi:hypothetical protein